VYNTSPLHTTVKHIVSLQTILCWVQSAVQIRYSIYVHFFGRNLKLYTLSRVLMIIAGVWTGNLSTYKWRLATGWTTERSGFESRKGQEFSLLHVVQTGSGFHPTSYTMGPGGSFSGVKRPGREADHSPPTSAEVKKMWIYTSTTPYAFMA
jgi:hypothetical protein